MVTHTSKKAHVGACNRLKCKTSVRKSEPEHHISWHVNELLGYIHMWLKIVILQATQGLFESIYVCMCVCVCYSYTLLLYIALIQSSAEPSTPAMRCTLMSKGAWVEPRAHHAIIKHDGTWREENIWHC